MRDRLERRLGAAERRLAAARRQLSAAEADLADRRRDEVVSGAGSLLDLFLGGRSSTRSLARQAARGAGRLSSRRSHTSRVASRRDAAQQKVEEAFDTIREPEDELAAEAADIDARWRQRAESIEVLEVGLESRDIDVDEVRLVWIPTG